MQVFCIEEERVSL